MSLRFALLGIIIVIGIAVPLLISVAANGKEADASMLMLQLNERVPTGAITVKQADVPYPVSEFAYDWMLGPLTSSISYEPARYTALVGQASLTKTNPQATAEPFSFTLPAKIIVLDPGHGGIDPGAVISEELYEKDIVYEYALAAKARLVQAGYIVHLTHEVDASCSSSRYNYKRELKCRADFAGSVQGDIFISIHADANELEDYRGTMTFYNARRDFDGRQNPYPEQSRTLAQTVHSYVQPIMESADLGVANQSYYVNRMNTVPSILIELGVMTNKHDLELLLNPFRPAWFAGALTTAIDDYFGQITAN